MGRISHCQKTGVKKGAWTPEEDKLLAAYITRYGHWNWHELPRFAGLSRCGKSCRLRWLNYLKPNIKRGNFTKEEDEIITEMHKLHGNRWSKIASLLQGRTDNEIKNYWHTRLKKNYKEEQRSKGKRTKRIGNDIPIGEIQLSSVTSLILESSSILPISPQSSESLGSSQTSSDSSSSSMAESRIQVETERGTVIQNDDIFWKAFLGEDLYIPAKPSMFSFPPFEEPTYPCDFGNDYDMDEFFGSIVLFEH
ncbi:hypothetical protein ACHQM5_003513 [Ranunculus cassubicifolius]